LIIIHYNLIGLRGKRGFFSFMNSDLSQWCTCGRAGPDFDFWSVQRNPFSTSALECTSVYTKKQI